MSGALFGALLGILGVHEVASASSLHVDGGILQHWELPVHLPSDSPESSEPTTDPAELLPSDPSGSPESTTGPAEPLASDPPDPPGSPEPTTDPAESLPSDPPEPATDSSGEAP